MTSTDVTPYAIHCPQCGQQFLTKDQYIDQMMAADSLWKCPRCGQDANWDDDHYDSYCEQEQGALDE